MRKGLYDMMEGHREIVLLPTSCRIVGPRFLMACSLNAIIEPGNSATMADVYKRLLALVRKRKGNFYFVPTLSFFEEKEVVIFVEKIIGEKNKKKQFIFTIKQPVCRSEGQLSLFSVMEIDLNMR